MAITGIGGASALTLQAIGDMRSQLDDLQRQLGSGMKSTSYAGLGNDRGLTVGLRAQLVGDRRLPAVDHAGRRASRPDANRAHAVRQDRADHQVHDRPVAICLERQDADPGPTQLQGRARSDDRHAQHRRRRPLPVFRPQRRAGAGRYQRLHPQRRRPQGSASSRSSTSAAGTSAPADSAA